MQNTEKKKSGICGLITPENKKIVIAIAVTLAVVLAILAAVLIFAPSDPSGSDTISGTYSLSVSGIGSSYYTFSEDGTGALNYTVVEDGTEVKKDFTYRISSDASEITFTWQDSGESTTHSYATGSYNGTELIRINEENYYKQ
ncbi:MAG: hypothetical protein IJX92_00660 [Clostridia bacterium]|nr:hypothetical protein [Clostridia bacterium]